LTSGFVFEERKAPEFPDNQQLIDIAEWNRQHQTTKPVEPEKLSELDKLRKRALKGGLW
jgi:hypothetical protein